MSTGMPADTNWFRSRHGDHYRSDVSQRKVITEAEGAIIQIISDTRSAARGDWHGFPGGLGRQHSVLTM